MLAYYGPEWESLASRIVDRWCSSFSGNTGLQLPSTLGRNHGVLTNFSNNGNDAYVADLNKLAMIFNGSNNSVQVSATYSALISSKIFSLSFWMRTTAVNTNVFPFSLGNSASDNAVCGFRMSPEGTGRIALVFRDNTGNFVIPGDATVVNNSQWNHVCAVANGLTAQLYVNGMASGSASSIASLGASTINRVTIGALGRVSVVAFYSGMVDDAIILNAGLTPSEVLFLYEQGRGGGMLYQPPRRRSVAAIIAALVLACETGNYSLTGQAAGLFASRLLAADQAEYLLSGNAANTTASRLLSADPASYTATGNDAATICARLLDGGAAAYALTGTDAGLIANRKLTADQAVYFLAGNNAELLRSLKLNAGSMALQLDNFAASLLADRKISADGAQYILVVSDANLGDSASGVAPYYYLFMLRGPQ
jgi:hypothetical protein